MAGREADGALEVPREMALVHEAEGRRGVGNGPSPAKHRKRACDARLHLIGMRRHADFAAEAAVQMKRAEAGELREIVERDALGEMLVEELPGAPDGGVFVSVAQRGERRRTVPLYELMEKDGESAFAFEA